MANTIHFPDAAEQQKIAMNSGRNGRQGITPFSPTPGEKWACLMVKLHPDVTSGDYATLGSNINAVAGIQDVKLLIDMDELPALVDDVAYRYIIVGEINVRIDDVS